VPTVHHQIKVICVRWTSKPPFQGLCTLQGLPHYEYSTEAPLTLHSRFKESRGVEYGHKALFVLKLYEYHQFLPRENNSKLSQSAANELSSVTDCDTEDISHISLTQNNLAEFLERTSPIVVSGQINPDWDCLQANHMWTSS
jgi:hypothetical protein